MIFHIFTKSKFNNSEFNEILSQGYTIPDKTVKQLGGKVKALEYIKKDVGRETLIEKFNEEDQLGSELVDIEIVTDTKGKWVDGEYYAHEYGDSGYCSGRGRITKYSNGFKECEVQCLDKSKSVADGLWEWSDTASGRVDNGCGDYFSPNQHLT
jgi:hypothetical protein